MSKERTITLLLILLITPIGFYTKFYSGPGEEWVHNYLGGMLYVIFWMLIFSFLLPQAKARTLALWVFTGTSVIEFLQLWHPPFLETLRSNFIGRTILGNSFTWYDFPWYLAGAIVGYFILKQIKKQSRKKS